MKTIGIDASSANKTERTGVEWYGYHLIQAMKRRALGGTGRVVLYAPGPLRDGLGDLPEGWEARHLHWPLRKGWMQGRVSAEMTVAPPDLLFVPGQALPRILPKRTATTVHDIGFRRIPEAYQKREREKLEKATEDAARRADRIFTVSEFTKAELIDAYGVAGDRVTVAPIALNTKAVRRPDESSVRHILDERKLFKPFFLYAGRLEEKKGVGTIVDAFGRFILETRHDMELVLVGKPGFGYERLRGQVAAMGSFARVRELGYVPDRALAALFASAQAFLFPSRYEGFGMPNLEAMALGTPVIASDIPPHREVCADAALYAPVADADAWAQAMVRVTKDRDSREELARKGRERAGSFSWEKTADRVWDGLQDLL